MPKTPQHRRSASMSVIGPSRRSASQGKAPVGITATNPRAWPYPQHPHDAPRPPTQGPPSETVRRSPAGRGSPASYEIATSLCRVMPLARSRLATLRPHAIKQKIPLRLTAAEVSAVYRLGEKSFLYGSTSAPKP